MELRERRRYRLALAVTYLWGSDERLQQGTGTTRDISVASVYVTSDDFVPTGTDVWLRLAIPPITEGGRGSKLEGAGRIVRSDTRGFAAVASIGFPVDLLRPDNEDDDVDLLVAKKKAAACLAIRIAEIDCK